VKRCLAPRPEDRYASAEKILDVFEPRRWILKWAVAAMFVLVVGLALGLWQASREKPSGPPVRLAVLPIAVEGDGINSAAGIANDVADRLSGLRKNFLVIPPGEALRNPVKDVEEAKSILGATHAFVIRLHNSNGRITAEASIVDTSSGQMIRELRGSYAAGDTTTIEKALLATVTGAFHLRAAPPEAVSAAAHPFYIQGIAVIRRDTESADEAIPLLSKAVELDPTSASPYAGLAQAQAQKFHNGQGRQWLDMAAVSVAKAKSINADSEQVLLASGLVQEEQGRYEPAIRDFSRVTELNPNNVEAWRLLASGYEDSNRPEDAVATYQRAIQVTPNYYRTYLNLGAFYYHRSQFQEAERLYRRAVEISPKLSEGHMDLGLALVGQGRFSEAEYSMLTSLRLRETPRGFVNLGFLYYTQARFQEAAGMFEKSLAGTSRAALWYWDLGAAYEHVGRRQDAIAAYRAGSAIAADEVAHNPRRAASRALMALLWGYLGNSSRALFEITQALETEPDNVLIKRYAIFTYERLREREKTLAVLRDAPASLLEELRRQPDLEDLRRDAGFQELLQEKSIH
jgi:tetratricopeptide (TPR) repeat protein